MMTNKLHIRRKMPCASLLKTQGILHKITNNKINIVILAYFVLLSYLCIQNQKNEDMTATQLNAELLRNMSIIAEDENLLKRAARYLRKLVAEKEDSSLFTKEEFFHRIDEAKNGPSYELREGETIE